ncbi:hypothetical protein MMC09_006676 [Bachmanniomyces sp. S44760]|nr:hypothetical protein [Bachmanniomyces sp. S44760]
MSSPIVTAVTSLFQYPSSFQATLVSSKRQVCPSQAKVPLPFRLEPLKSVELYEISIAEIQKHYTHGTFTATEYIQYCLDRVRLVDPYLEAVIELNPDALEIAAQLDEERQRGHVRSSLHGIPVFVKDNIATKDKMQTTAGSWALLGSVVPRDAFIVAQLRHAGAIILGHTGILMGIRHVGVKSGIHLTYRAALVGKDDHIVVTKIADRIAVGSSGGSAVAVSSNMVPLTFGSETDGSIIGPAQINSVVGIKPTPGLTSRSGIIPSSYSLDTVGPLGRSVQDAVLGLNAIVGSDERDPLTLGKARHQDIDYTQFLRNQSSLRGAKFGLPIKRCWEFVKADQKREATRILDGIVEAGGEIIHLDYQCAEERIASNGKWDWELGGSSKSEFTVVATEAYNGIKDYLSELSNTNITTLEDIVAFNVENRGTEGAFPGDHPAFPTGQDTFHQIVATRGTKDDSYYEALNHIQKQTRSAGIDAALTHTGVDGRVHELDALILCDRLLVGQQIAAQAGYPTINVPIGVDDAGMPVSITLQQTAWKEGVLIKWASAIEDLRNKILGGRPTPEYNAHLAKNVPIGRKHIPPS